MIEEKILIPLWTLNGQVFSLLKVIYPGLLNTSALEGKGQMHGVNGPCVFYPCMWRLLCSTWAAAGSPKHSASCAAKIRTGLAHPQIGGDGFWCCWALNQHSNSELPPHQHSEQVPTSSVAGHGREWEQKSPEMLLLPLCTLGRVWPEKWQTQQSSVASWPSAAASAQSAQRAPRPRCGPGWSHLTPGPGSSGSPAWWGPHHPAGCSASTVLGRTWKIV